MLNIGDLARLAGVTARTIRHYHAIGLMPEPVRSEGGYRQYDVRDLLRLLRIRRLSSLGMSLPQVAELLEAPETQAQELLDQLDRELAAQLAVLEEQRRVLAVLREHAVDPELPETFAPALAALRQAGLPPTQLAQEREAILMISALGAEAWLMEVYAERGEGAVEAYVDFMRRFDALSELSPDDPMVDSVLRDLIELQTPMLERLHEMSGPFSQMNPEIERALGEYWSPGRLGPAQQRVVERAMVVAEKQMATMKAEPEAVNAGTEAADLAPPPTDPT